MRAPEQNRPGRTPKWLPPDREWIRHQVLVLHKSARQMAGELGCSEWRTQRWVRRAGLRDPVPVSDEADAPLRIGQGAGARFENVTRTWLYRQYIELDKSAQQIADEIGATRRTVWAWLQKLNIPIRTREEMNDRHSERMSGEGNPAWNGGTAQNYQKRVLERSGRPKTCEWCGTRKRVQVHHRDHDRMNGALENLTWLCGPCNRMEAQLWALEKAGRVEVRFDPSGRTLTVRFIRR